MIAKLNFQIQCHMIPQKSNMVLIFVETMIHFFQYFIDESEVQKNSIYNPKSEKVGTVWKTQIKKESSDF